MNDKFSKKRDGKQQFALCYFRHGFFRENWIFELGYTYEETFDATDKFHQTCTAYKILSADKEEISEEINRCTLIKAKITFTNKNDYIYND